MFVYNKDQGFEFHHFMMKGDGVLDENRSAISGKLKKKKLQFLSILCFLGGCYYYLSCVPSESDTRV